MSAVIAPDFLVFVKNLVDSLPSIYSIIRIIIAFSAIIFIWSGVMDLAQSSNKQSKYFSAGNQPTYGGGLVKILMGGFAFTLADNLFLVGVASSVFMGGAAPVTEVITLSSYVGATGELEEVKYTKILLQGLLQAVGIVAIFQGIRIIVKIADGQANTTVAQGLMFILFGALCYQSVWLHYTMANIIGFDIGALVGLSGGT